MSMLKMSNFKIFLQSFSFQSGMQRSVKIKLILTHHRALSLEWANAQWQRLDSANTKTTAKSHLRSELRDTNEYTVSLKNSRKMGHLEHFVIDLG